ncbi:glycosyltransferase family 2 protein [Alteromonas sp. CYL-A6]|uniref:glycosyltransferase family 2 protein n=1 Tax=Alteromonas nitratireducens TaxID=3390813 RepID=UPI0034C1B704
MVKVKKYAMMTVKAGVGLIPKSVREHLKKSPALSAFYSRALQRSGLFYGFPSKKKLTRLYRDVVLRQRTVLTQHYGVKKTGKPLNVLVMPGARAAVATTLDSLNAQAERVGAIYLVSEVGDSPASTSRIQHVATFTELAESVGSSPLLLLMAGDTLHENALSAFCAHADQADILYCDTDEVEKGQRVNPRLLPDWNPDLQLTTAYVDTGVVLANPAESLQVALEQARSFSCVAEVVTAIWLNTPALKVQHIALSLVAHKPSGQRTRDALGVTSGWLDDRGISSLFDKQNGVNAYLWPADNQPLVSLIIPTKNAHELVKACIDSITEKTHYTHYEILLIDNNSDDPDSLAYFEEVAKHPKVRLLRYPQPFNYSAINNFAVSQARGDIIGLINNDVEVIGGQWLSYMVGHAVRADIGCVGAKLLYSDGRIQHAGVVMGYGGGAGHAHKYFPRYHPGYLNRLVATQNYSAVTAACLLVKREHYEAVGGLNERDLTVAFNDVDFCLKVRELGVRNLYCAEAELFHHESVSRGLDATKEKRMRFLSELDYLQSTWQQVIQHDPAYNPFLTLKRENFAVKAEEEFE